MSSRRQDRLRRRYEADREAERRRWARLGVGGCGMLGVDGGGGVATPAVYVLDHFTGADSTAINGRTPDTVQTSSNVWAVDTFNGGVAPIIRSNHAVMTTYSPGGNGFGMGIYDCAHADGTLRLNFLFGSSDIEYHTAGAILRYQDTSNYLWVRAFASATVNTGADLTVHKKVGGSFTSLSSVGTGVGMAINTLYTLTATMSGTTVNVTISGGVSITTGNLTVSDFSTLTKHGFQIAHSTGTDTPGAETYVDDFQVGP